jgi:hypothetical protein
VSVPPKRTTGRRPRDRRHVGSPSPPQRGVQHRWRELAHAGTSSPGRQASGEGTQPWLSPLRGGTPRCWPARRASASFAPRAGAGSAPTPAGSWPGTVNRRLGCSSPRLPPANPGRPSASMGARPAALVLPASSAANDAKPPWSGSASAGLAPIAKSSSPWPISSPRRWCPNSVTYCPHRSTRALDGWGLSVIESGQFQRSSSGPLLPLRVGQRDPHRRGRRGPAPRLRPQGHL